MGTFLHFSFWSISSLASYPQSFPTFSTTPGRMRQWARRSYDDAMLEGVSGEFDDLDAQNMRDFFIVPGVWVPCTHTSAKSSHILAGLSIPEIIFERETIAKITTGFCLRVWYNLGVENCRVPILQEPITQYTVVYEIVQAYFYLPKSPVYFVHFDPNITGVWCAKKQSGRACILYALECGPHSHLVLMIC